MKWKTGKTASFAFNDKDHFSNKEGLWKDVKLAISARYYETYNPVALAAKQDLQEFLRNCVQNRFAFLQKNQFVENEACQQQISIIKPF